jgi:hypothetical protein
MSIGEAAFFVNVAGVFPYLKGTLWGPVRPERTTWLIWSVILGLSLLGYRELGAEDSIWFALADFLVCFTVFVISLFRGTGGWSRFDLICLGVALLGVVAWQASDRTILVFAGTLTADVMGLLPTLKKSLQDPTSERASVYVCSSLASAMGFIAVGVWDWSLMFYPLYLFLVNGIVAQTVLVGQYQLRKAKRVAAHA